MVSQAKDGAIVLAHQFLERGVIATLRFPDQLRVVHAALGLPHHRPSIGESRGRFVRRPPRLRSAEPRANRERELQPLRPAYWFLPSLQLASQFSCLQLHRRAPVETVSGHYSGSQGVYVVGETIVPDS